MGVRLNRQSRPPAPCQSAPSTVELLSQGTLGAQPVAHGLTSTETEVKQAQRPHWPALCGHSRWAESPLGKPLLRQEDQLWNLVTRSRGARRGHPGQKEGQAGAGCHRADVGSGVSFAGYPGAAKATSSRPVTLSVRASHQPLLSWGLGSPAWLGEVPGARGPRLSLQGPRTGLETPAPHSLSGPPFWFLPVLRFLKPGF